MASKKRAETISRLIKYFVYHNPHDTSDSALNNGFLGSIAGCKICVSNNVGYVDGVHKCIMRTKRAVAFAEQISEVHAYRPESRFADAVKGLHLYGASIIYPQEYILMNCVIA